MYSLALEKQNYFHKLVISINVKTCELLEVCFDVWCAYMFELSAFYVEKNLYLGNHANFVIVY